MEETDKCEKRHERGELLKRPRVMEGSVVMSFPSWDVIHFTRGVLWGADSEKPLAACQDTAEGCRGQPWGLLSWRLGSGGMDFSSGLLTV
jgi:hypothetical protein